MYKVIGKLVGGQRCDVGGIPLRSLRDLLSLKRLRTSLGRGCQSNEASQLALPGLFRHPALRKQAFDGQIPKKPGAMHQASLLWSGKRDSDPRPRNLPKPLNSKPLTCDLICGTSLLVANLSKKVNKHPFTDFLSVPSTQF